MKLRYFIFIFNSFLIFNTNFCPTDKQIWVQPKDSKEPIAISTEIAKLSEFLNNSLKQSHDNTKSNPIKLPQILEKQFNTFKV